MKKIIFFFLLIIFSFNFLQSQNWDWQQQISMHSEIIGVYPTPYNKWVMVGKFRETPVDAFRDLNLIYIALIDSSGTISGELLPHWLNSEIELLNDTTLILAHNNNQNTELQTRYIRIEENKISPLPGFRSYPIVWELGKSTNGKIILFDRVWENGQPAITIVKEVEYGHSNVNNWFFENSLINDFQWVDHEEYLAAGNIQFEGDKFGLMKVEKLANNNLDTIQVGLEYISINKIFQLPNGQILAVNNASIFKLDANLNLIERSDFNFLENYIDLSFNGNSVFVLTKIENDKPKIFQINESLEWIEIFEFGNNNTFPKNIISNGNQIGVSATISPSLNPSPFIPTGSFYFKVFQPNQTFENESTNVELSDITIDKFEIEDIDCTNAVSGSLKNIKLEIKNIGNDTINELFVNLHRNELLCNISIVSTFSFSQKQFNLNLAPNESTTLQIQKIPFITVGDNELDENFQEEFCFYISAVNHNVDVDFSNNKFCKNVVIGAIEIEDPILVHPNPATNFINIRKFYYSNPRQVLVKIYNSMGQLVHEQKIPELEQYLNVNIANFNSGAYFIQVIDGKNIDVQKFLKR